MNKLERLKITSKITNRKIKRMKVIHIHLFLPFIHAVRRERKGECWDEPSKPREGAEENGEGEEIATDF